MGDKNLFSKQLKKRAESENQSNLHLVAKIEIGKTL